ncbi:TPA: fimbrial protein [Citrobacter werkmanii]
MSTWSGFFAGCLLLGTGLSAVAADEIDIRFQGTVVDAPCVIAPESVDMTVDLGNMDESRLSFQKHSNPAVIRIDLTSCVLQGMGAGGGDISKVSVEFDSTAVVSGNANILANTDSSGAVNVGVQLLTTDDEAINLGESLPVDLQVTSSEQTLVFHAWMVPADPKNAMSPGHVSANTSYVLNYL